MQQVFSKWRKHRHRALHRQNSYSQGTHLYLFDGKTNKTGHLNIKIGKQTNNWTRYFQVVMSAMKNYDGVFLFQHPIILPFHTVHGVFKARILKWFAIPFSSGPHSVRMVTANGDCSHEIKRRLSLRRKATTNLDSILKNRDITLPTKVHIVKAMVFPVVIYECESWTVKKAKRQRIDDFELQCWKKLFS